MVIAALLLGHIRAEQVTSRVLLPHHQIAVLVRVPVDAKEYLLEEQAYRVELRFFKSAEAKKPFATFSDRDNAHDGRLIIGDFQNNGSKSLAAMLRFPAHYTGNSPTTLHLFTLAAGSIREIGRLQSNDDIYLRKTSNGLYVFLDDHVMYTYGLSTVDSPHCQNAWGWEGGRFHVVESGLRSLYAKNAKELWTVLEKAPNERSVWHYYGVATKRAGLKVSPRAAYQRIIAAHEPNEPKPTDRTMGSLTAWRKRNQWPGPVGYFTWFDATPFRKLTAPQRREE